MDKDWRDAWRNFGRQGEEEIQKERNMEHREVRLAGEGEGRMRQTNQSAERKEHNLLNSITSKGVILLHTLPFVIAHLAELGILLPSWFTLLEGLLRPRVWKIWSTKLNLSLFSCCCC